MPVALRVQAAPGLERNRPGCSFRAYALIASEDACAPVTLALQSRLRSS